MADKIKLVLGTMTFGESVFGSDVKDMIQGFLNRGYDELDTAYVYNNGECERLLGEALEGMDRGAYKIATKANPRISGRLDKEAVLSQMEESLKRLRLDRVDTLYLHFPDPGTPVESALEGCAQLHGEGKFTELGLSNFPAWMVADTWHICDKHGWAKPTVYEGVYNPLARKAEVELNACLNAYGMRFYAFNPMAGGLLTGRYGKFEDAPTDGRFTHRPNYQGRYWKKSCFDALDVIRQAAQARGMTMIEAAYRWLAFHSMLDGERGDAILIGASKLEHMRENMEAIKAGPLPADVAEAFEEARRISEPDSPEYFTLYKGKGSVGGEKK